MTARLEKQDSDENQMGGHRPEYEDIMTKPLKASDTGLRPHFKVRVVIPGALIHLASWTEPRETGAGWLADWIGDPAYGDTLGYIDWAAVAGITWRWSA